MSKKSAPKLKPDSLALARALPAGQRLAPEQRAAIEAAMPDKARAFYYHYCECLNATEAMRRTEQADPRAGSDPADSAIRQRARYTRSRDDVQALVRDDFDQMQMSAAEAKARLAAIAREASMSNFVDENDAIIPGSIQRYGAAVKEFSSDILSTDAGDVKRVKIKLHDSASVIDRILKAMPKDEGGAMDEAPTVNFFTQINGGTAPQDT